MITGAQAMVKCLESEDISVIFGYPGGAICPFYDSLRESNIQHVLVRQEQNAGHMASGYARMTGKPAVCVVTSGPGATNLITALATAYMDSIPLIAITGQVSSELLGRDVFQEVDITGSSEPFTKYTYLVKNAKDIPRIFREAFYIASSGRPGPVIIDIPIDIQKQCIDYEKYPQEVNIRGYKPTVKGHGMQVKKVASAIKEAKKPLLCVGGGVFASKAEDELRQFAAKYRIPVVSTLMGIGAMPTEDPLYFGMLGQSGQRYANKAVNECDVLIIVGARVADRAVSTPHLLEQSTIVIHIDVDPAEIGKNLGTTIPLVGDAKHILNQIMKLELIGEYKEWVDELTQYRAETPAFNEDREGYVNPQKFIYLLSEKLEDNSIMIADVGQNQMWAARNYIVKKGKFMTSGGMGTMGYAIPAAIGARAAEHKKQIVAVCGDGSFQMSMMELATMNQHNLPVKILLMRNGYLGMVREIQKNSFDNRLFGVDLSGSPDFGKIAEAYGIPFIRISDMTQAEEGINQFLAEKGACMMECNVHPMEGSY